MHTLCSSSLVWFSICALPSGVRCAQADRAVERVHLLAVDHAGGVRGDWQADQSHVVVALEIHGRQFLANQHLKVDFVGKGATSVVRLAEMRSRKSWRATYRARCTARDACRA